MNQLTPGIEEILSLESLPGNGPAPWQVGKRLRDEIPVKKGIAKTPPVFATDSNGGGREQQGNRGKVGGHDEGGSEDENSGTGTGGVRGWAAGTSGNPYSSDVIGVSGRKSWIEGSDGKLRVSNSWCTS